MGLRKVETKIKTKVCFGIQSTTEDNKHIFMIDYDGNDYKLFKSELLYLQKTFKLSDIYILKTFNGYNAFTIDKLSLSYLVNVLCNSDIVDKQFILLGKQRKHYTLRMGSDKEFMGTMISSNRLYQKSLAHYKFFTEIMMYPVYKDGEFDDLYSYVIDAYRSMKHGNTIQL